MFIQLLLILLATVTFASESLVIKSNDEKIDKFILEYYYDSTGKLDIDNIKKIDFKEHVSNQFAFGYLEGNSWFKLKIKNKTKNDKIYLYMSEPFFEEVNLFQYQDSKYKKIKNGLNIALDKRDIFDISPVFILNIKPNDEKIFYIQAFAKFAQFGEFQIYTDKEFITKHRLYVTTLYVFFLGSLFMIIVFNSFLFLTLKEKIYLYYVGYIFFHTIFIFGFSGLNIYLGFANLHYDIHLFSIPLLIIFLILFSMNFLNIKDNLQYTYNILVTIIYAYIFLMIMTFIQFNPWYQLITSLASLTYIILLYMSIRIWIFGHSKAKYYLFAMVIYTSSITIMSLMINGVLPNNDMTRYAFLFGSFIEILLFSLLLANRFHEMQNEKIKIQNELIKIKDKNEYFLENEVLIRTEKIKTLLDEKELLLKEVFHRVKNNFQIVLSILSLEANKNISQKSYFIELINRIKSMSLVHQFLYESDSLSQIQSHNYILKIIQNIKKVYIKQDITIDAKIDEIVLNMTENISIGVIINEILNNSIKHNNSGDCKILLEFIKFKEDDTFLELIISDNNDVVFDINKVSNGLGLGLVKQFSKKLKNHKIDFQFSSGVKFILNFEREKL